MGCNSSRHARAGAPSDPATPKGAVRAYPALNKIIAARLNDAREMMREGTTMDPNAIMERLISSEYTAETRATIQAAIAELWVEVDLEKNMELTHEDNQQLMKAYLESAKSWVPEIVLLATRMFGSAALTRKEGEPEAVYLDKKAKFETDMKVLKEHIPPIIERYINSLDAKGLADEAFYILDSDKDGHVKKSEFIRNFEPAAARVVNITTIFQKANAVMQDESRRQDDARAAGRGRRSGESSSRSAPRSGEGAGASSGGGGGGEASTASRAPAKTAAAPAASADADDDDAPGTRV